MKLERILNLHLDEKEFAFVTGVSFSGLSITEKDAGYTVVLRGRDRAGEPVYMITYAEDPMDGLAGLMAIASGQGGRQVWRADRFRS